MRYFSGHCTPQYANLQSGRRLDLTVFHNQEPVSLRAGVIRQRIEGGENGGQNSARTLLCDACF